MDLAGVEFSGVVGAVMSENGREIRGRGTKRMLFVKGRFCRMIGPIVL